MIAPSLMDEESEALIATLFGFEHVPGLSVAHPEHVSMSEQPLLRFSSEKKTSRRNIAGRFIDEGRGVRPAGVHRDRR